MMSGLFDHSAIWSRTKMCRRNRSSVVWASEIRSGRLGIAPSGAEANCRHRIDDRHAIQVVNIGSFLGRMLPAGPRTMRDRRPMGEAPDAIAVIDERLRTEPERRAGHVSQ